jgi:hypothetical protein
MTSTIPSGRFNACAILVAADPVASVVVLEQVSQYTFRSEERGVAYSFANSPFKAANAPLAIASVTHLVTVIEIPLRPEEKYVVIMDGRKNEWLQLAVNLDGNCQRVYHPWIC